MNLELAVAKIRSHFERMDELYGKVIFDEWLLAVIHGRKARLLHYVGVRPDDLKKAFGTDLHDFSRELSSGRRELGHYEFSRYASGTYFDAYMVVGPDTYLFCNNTTQSMAGITRDDRWLKAQVPFVELSEWFRENPPGISAD